MPLIYQMFASDASADAAAPTRPPTGGASNRGSRYCIEYFTFRATTYRFSTIAGRTSVSVFRHAMPSRTISQRDRLRHGARACNAIAKYSFFLAMPAGRRISLPSIPQKITWILSHFATGRDFTSGLIFLAISPRHNIGHDFITIPATRLSFHADSRWRPRRETYMLFHDASPRRWPFSQYTSTLMVAVVRATRSRHITYFSAK